MTPPSLSKNSMEVMTLVDDHHTPLSITLEGTNLIASYQPFLTKVPANVVATPSPLLNKLKIVGCFVGFDSDQPRSRQVAPIGKLNGIRIMSIFRFKVWWTTQWVGSSGCDYVTVEWTCICNTYVLLLPIIEGSFRASLQPGVEDYVDICVESGSTQIRGSYFRSCLYMHVGDNPFSLVKEAMEVIRVHFSSFKLLKEKTPPSIVDKFGWCTWDAFYLAVHPKSVWQGVKGLVEGGSPPGMVLIADGWQSICHDDETGMPCRLIKFEENKKFRDYESEKGRSGMGGFVTDLKEEFKSVEHVYVWHALCGYCGGVRPNVAGMLPSRVIRPKLSVGLKMTMKDMAVDKIVNSGVGIVPPEMVDKMYEGLHSHLKLAGIDGVKVDVIHSGAVAKAYYKALTASVRKHFKGNGVIASMEHCNDFMYLGKEAIVLGRVGDDFWCTGPSGDPNGRYWLQGCHMVHCAYNCLWMGNFIQPDWDTFQSTHSCAEFHAASRAISGGPIYLDKHGHIINKNNNFELIFNIYISDFVGNHNFKLLKRLVLPDGSILRCQYYALPTGDCLFKDLLHDGKAILKIWNLNKCPVYRRNKSAYQFSGSVTCVERPKDIEWSSGKNPVTLNGVNIFPVYSFQEKKLKLVKSSESLEISLEPFNYELFTVSPVSILQRKLIQFAPIGLVNMLNLGGAIQSLIFEDDKNKVRIGDKGSGEMRVFASEMPVTCRIDGEEADYSYGDLMVII
ncbi:hypothetical protein K2173_026949 [Erythroxylum novogranatense]|uniref:galactinol--sucrose galactosyltransferase n=1 Tax=Erythroxylum novogranatense TaxID=1862640 RepID=A0AAV8TXJ6_9ROSI|nr:hypothetical protein K2173_026949 [Erythroxylum novogranatense]